MDTAFGANRRRLGPAVARQVRDVCHFAMIGQITRFETSRYTIVGATVAVLNNVVLIGGDRLGIAYPVLVAMAWALGGTLAYGLHARWTFRQGLGRSAYARFMAGAAVGVPLAMAAVWLFFQALRWPMAVAAPAATLVMFAYNYLSARLAILWRHFWSRAL
jgi:putative flippase GtrA